MWVFIYVDVMFDFWDGIVLFGVGRLVGFVVDVF